MSIAVRTKIRREAAGRFGGFSAVTKAMSAVVKKTIEMSNANLNVMKGFVAANDWIDFLAKTPETLSNTSVCFTLKATPDQVKAMIKLLDKEGVAYDIGAYRDAPPGLRIWCGATVGTKDLQDLLPWLTWAYQEATK